MIVAACPSASNLASPRVEGEGRSDGKARRPRTSAPESVEGEKRTKEGKREGEREKEKRASGDELASSFPTTRDLSVSLVRREGGAYSFADSDTVVTRTGTVYCKCMVATSILYKYGTPLVLGRGPNPSSTRISHEVISHPRDIFMYWDESRMRNGVSGMGDRYEYIGTSTRTVSLSSLLSEQEELPPRERGIRSSTPAWASRKSDPSWCHPAGRRWRHGLDGEISFSKSFLVVIIPDGGGVDEMDVIYPPRDHERRMIQSTTHDGFGVSKTSVLYRRLVSREQAARDAVDPPSEPERSRPDPRPSRARSRTRGIATRDERHRTLSGAWAWAVDRRRG